jgi:hypothetical protein
MKSPLIALLLFVSVCVHAQDESFGFPFGKVTLAELNSTSYQRDTSASAVYLNEYGLSYFDADDHDIIHRYHAVIKILKPRGLDLANYSIGSYRDGTRAEIVRTVRASSFTLEGGSMKETQLEPRNIFRENTTKNIQVTKFAVPNVKVGSIIEIAYETKSPYVYNFKSWEFQDVIPKVKTVYEAVIPAIYTYNISLIGFLKLQTNEGKILKGCMTWANTNIDCSRFKYGMTNVPAFREEEYMTAKKNFLSAINYELAEHYLPSGGVNKITKEWKDAEQELKKHEAFGQSIKKNGDQLEDQISALLTGITDPLEKSRKIYGFVKDYFVWDGSHDMFAEGVKKAIQNKKGNTADINLFLTGALQNQDIDAAPVILSTRSHGAVNELYPVISGFNYVVAGVTIGDKLYLLDATDDYLPFGFLPEKCLNGKGRLLMEKGSKWVELKPADKGKNVVMIDAVIGADGILRGTIATTYTGYEAITFRKQYYAHDNHEDYLKELRSKLSSIEIKKLEVENIDKFDQPVVRKLDIEIAASDDMSNMFLFNPHILGKWKENPFKSNERQYPVDFGAPVELTTIMNLSFPSDLEVVNLPEKIGLTLPNAGGRYLVDAQWFDNKLTLTNSLQINKTIFTSNEYHYLRELFQKVIEVQNTDLMFKKKT